MKIEITVFRENEDGSADVEVAMDAEAKDMLIRKAIIDSITESAKYAVKNYTPKENNDTQ